MVFQISGLILEHEYFFSAFSFDEVSNYSVPATGSIILSSVGIVEGVLPRTHALYSPFPNPGRAPVTVICDVPIRQNLSLDLFGVDGRVMRRFFHGLSNPARYVFVWDGRDDREQPIPSGVYFVRMQAGAFEARRKLVVIR